MNDEDRYPINHEILEQLNDPYSPLLSAMDALLATAFDFHAGCITIIRTTTEWHCGLGVLTIDDPRMCHHEDFVEAVNMVLDRNELLH